MTPRHRSVAVAAAALALTMAGSRAQGADTCSATSLGNTSQLTSQQVETIITNSDVLNLLAHADALEIEVATMAKDKLQSNALKVVNQQLLKDHQASLDTVKGLAGTLKVPLADFHASGFETSQKNILSQMNGAQFDDAYVQILKSGHLTLQQQLQQMQARVQDPKLQQLITDTLPVVQHHIDLLSNVDPPSTSQ